MSAHEKTQRLSLAIMAFSAGLFVGFLVFSAWPRWRSLKEQERRQEERMQELERIGERTGDEAQSGEMPK